MTPEEFKGAMLRLGLDPRGMGELLDRHQKTVYLYSAGRIPIPKIVERIIEYELSRQGNQ